MRYTHPYRLAATVPPEELVRALVRNLVDAVGGRAGYEVAGADGRVVTVASWPEHPGGARTGEVLREPVAGGGVVYLAGPWRWGAGERTILRDTATWLGVALRLDRLRAQRDRAHERAQRLRAEVTSARERLAEVRDLERRRLVGAITTTTLRDLAEFRARLTALADGDPTAADVAGAGAFLDDLLDNFRTIVRGVYPAMLPDRGPRAALEELAATVSRPVHFRGDLGRRVGWQVESGLYHAVAAVLNLLAGLSADEPVVVDFLRDDALRVTITAPAGPLSARSLRAALDHDAQRLAVLGGAMECQVTGDTAVVRVRVLDRIEPVAEAAAPPLEGSPLYRQARDLVRRGRSLAGDGQERDRWDAIAARMAAPPRIAVVGGPPDGAVPGGAVVVVADGPADAALAAEFLADDGPRGAIDAVLCLVPPAEAFRTALRRGRQRVVLSESASVADLAADLAAWRPVLAARRAIVTATALVGPNHPLSWAVERIAAEAHELAELDLLDRIRAGDVRLPPGESGADVARLLGADGPDPRARLGLAADASDDAVRVAAGETVRRWRAHAAHPATGARERVAWDVLVRTAEGLLKAARHR
ncbi:hypothetical protein [Actinophytocola sp. KF-1]